MITEDLIFEDRDEFDRKPIAEKIIKLLQAEIDISPMVIDGNWGTGKTEFCYKLINLFKKEGTHNVIYIDAFKADHIDDPLLSIIAEIIKINQDENKQKKIIKKIAPIIGYGTKVLGKSIVYHLLKQDINSIIIEGYDETIQKIADKAIDVGVGVMLKEYIEAEKNLKALQKVLKEITQNNPIVIFIDELDRCRPDFAIKILEVIKHTFNIDNLQFVLVTNMEQLKASVNHCYGNGVNAQNYLNKFLKFRIELPFKTSPFSNRPLFVDELASVKYFNSLIESSMELRETPLIDETNQITRLVYHCIKNSDLSLRQVESLVRHFEVYNIIEDRVLDAIQILAICLYVVHPDYVTKILKGCSDACFIAESLGVSEFDNFDRPTPPQIYTVILASRCKLNSNKFSEHLSDEHFKYYTKGLSGIYHIDSELDRKEIMDIFIETLATLNLSTNY